MNSLPTPSNIQRVFDLSSEQDTDALGTKLADAVEPGLVIGLVGQLGAGKTRLVRATAIALDADPRAVNSPTFVLIQEYFGRIPIYHFDTYRLPDSAAFADLGADEYFYGDGICFVEWSDRVQWMLPNDHLRIEITATGPTSRRIDMTASGAMSARVLQRLWPRPI